jgi:hypothetical protein
MLLNLSPKTVADPCVERDQPSGTFTVKPPPDGDHATYAWVSGMSPGGADSWAGAGDDDEGGAAEVPADPEDAVDPDDPDEEEQATAAPVRSTRPAVAAAMGRRLIGRHLRARVRRQGHRLCS